MKNELNNLKSEIQNLLADPGYRPLRFSELIRTLGIPPAQRRDARRALDRLVQEGTIVRLHKDRLVLPSEADLVAGRIQMHERGFGFVAPENSASSDIFVAAEDTGVAMHGDRVLVRLHANAGRRPSRRSEPDGARRCGRVIRVLERANATLVGVLQHSPRFHYVVPDEPRIGRDIYVNLQKSLVKARIGDRVIVKLALWEHRHVNPEGEIVEVVGRADDPRLDSLAIIKRLGLRTDFPHEALAEAEAISEEIPAPERNRRMDFTGETVITIDPEDARDYDDALSLKKLAHGKWLVGVHIADVSHYVRPHTPLDREASLRGNSVYFPDRVLPMLPPRLSNRICSLQEGVERLCRSVLFEMHADGRVERHWFQDTIIRSAARLTYPQALSVIQPRPRVEPSVKDESIRQLLRDLWSLAARVRKRRYDNGSLDLDFPEIKIHCDASGRAMRIEKQENDISHQLVEEFMLLANEAVAAHTRHQTIPSIYRAHEDPDPEKLEEFGDLARAEGFTIGDPTVRNEIQKFLKRLAGQPAEYILKLNLLRSLKRARYDTTPIGHYGLAMDNYTHFTSPIRRYPDLVVHRMLPRPAKLTSTPWETASSVHGQSFPRPSMRYEVSTLDHIAAHCSTTERIADEAEKEAVQVKVLEYFERQVREQSLDTFVAMVTEVRNFGLFVELPDFLLSGLVHVSTLKDDFYRFDPARKKLTGKRNRRILRAGDRVRVEVARVDRFKKQVDFRLVGN
jgi:ribonuclease R